MFPLLIGFTTVVVIMFGFMMSILFVQKNKQNNYKRRLLEARVEEQEKTVNEISQNLHDDLAQLLAHVQMNLKRLDDFGIEKAKSIIESSSNYLREAMLDVRHMSHSLNSEWLRSRGLVGAIREDIEHVNETNHVHCTIVVHGDEYRMKHNYELPIFRITQEVIHNMFKHSKASTFVVSLDYKADLFAITFTDNGKGFNTKVSNPESGVGLANMRHRAKLLNADLQIRTVPKNGCIISLTLPVNDEMMEPVYED